MVTPALRADLGLYRRVLLKLLRRSFGRDSGQRSALGGELTRTLLDADFGSAMVRQLLQAQLGDSMVRILLESEADPAHSALAAGLSKMNLTSGQRDAIVIACCTGLQTGEASQTILDRLVGISGGALHYSQEGEDIILESLFPDNREGFFVDVGAHHATRFSNTYALYRRGWRGINIDASPGSMESFGRLRPRDINIECAVSDSEGSTDFHVFSEPALNTFDAGLARSYVASGAILERVLQISSRPLSSVLGRHLPEGQSIDLLNLDVEGVELSVLKSNDWSRHRPDVIVMEVLDITFPDLASHPAVAFVLGKGYTPLSRLTRSMVFRRGP